MVWLPTLILRRCPLGVLTERREFLHLCGALAGAIVLPIKLPRQWFVTRISGYVIPLTKGRGMYQWVRDIEGNYPSLKEVTLNVFWHGPDPVPSKYDDWPRWKMGDGEM